MTANLTAPALATDDAGRQVALIEDGKQQCSCSEGCPGRTTRFFSQGHDARMVTRLRNAVMAGEMTTAEAFAEVTRRGGTERLQIKLDAAVANARSKPAKKARKGKKAKVTTFELDGFTLHATPISTRPIVAKVGGRWENEGVLRTHRSGETGATKEDTFMVFEYTNKKGELVETTKYKFVRDLPVAEVAEAPAGAEPEVAELPVLVSLRGGAAAEAAREEVAELPINAFANRVATPAVPENTDDIPF